MAKSKIDIIYDMVNLAYDVKRQWSKDKDSIWLGEYARAVIKAKDEKVYDKFVDLANQLETEGWDEFVDACKYLIDEYNQIEESKESARKSIKESYPNYDVDDVYKELKRLCDKGKNVFSDFYVERNEDGFMVSISDDYSYIKLKDFIPYNIHYNENSFYMYYDNDSTYMTIFANYEDENAINVLVEVVRSLANLKGAYDKCETVSTEIVNQVSNLY